MSPRHCRVCRTPFPRSGIRPGVSLTNPLDCSKPFQTQQFFTVPLVCHASSLLNFFLNVSRSKLFSAKVAVQHLWSGFNNQFTWSHTCENNARVRTENRERTNTPTSAGVWNSFSTNSTMTWRHFAFVLKSTVVLALLSLIKIKHTSQSNVILLKEHPVLLPEQSRHCLCWDSQKHLETARRGHVVAVVLASTTCIPCIATAGEQSERPARLLGQVLETSACKSVTLTSFFQARLLRFRHKLFYKQFRWHMPHRRDRCRSHYTFSLWKLFSIRSEQKEQSFRCFHKPRTYFLVTFRVCSQSETSPSRKYDGKTTSTKP